MLWCEPCVEAAQRRAALSGWVLGGVLAVILALWIWLVAKPSDLILGGWITAVLAAFYLGARVARTLTFGILRFRNRPRLDDGKNLKKERN